MSDYIVRATVSILVPGEEGPDDHHNNRENAARIAERWCRIHLAHLLYARPGEKDVCIDVDAIESTK